MQLELLERPYLSAQELADVARDIRNLYWVIRNTRRGIHDAKRRRVYYKIAEHKKRLLMAGVSKEMILGLLRCCRARDCQGPGCFDCPNRRGQPTCKN
ncbi:MULTISPECIES: hypothetical protein [Burkholderia]|uniref:hypothetical protein n=1 Tax=Burkholderia TaxID=32008 RepID=UPI000A46C1A9|nr:MULTISPECIES: hypothetical protein [Burkholderia]